MTVATERDAPMFPVLLDGSGIAELNDRQHLDLSDGRRIPADWLVAVAASVRRGRYKRLAKTIGRHAATAIGVIAGLIAIVGVVVPLLTREDDPLPTFSADYGIGVAEFP